MPRGVYDRSKIKKKTEGEAPVAAKPALKAAPKAKTVTKVKAKTDKAEQSDNMVHNKTVVEDKTVVSQFAFNILGANLSTLSGAHEQLKESPELSGVVASEIIATVKTMGTLREAVFGSTKAEVAAEVSEGAEELVAEAPVETVTAPPAPPAPVATLPQPPSITPPTLHGNAAPFQPPAPPHLPGH